MRKVQNNVKNQNFLRTCESQIQTHAAKHKIINNKQTFTRARNKFHQNNSIYKKLINESALKKTIFFKFGNQNGLLKTVPVRYNSKMMIIEPTNSTNYKNLARNGTPMCSSARMNSSHIMVIPRIPIWNALSLSCEHITLLEEMMKYGKTYIEDIEKKNSTKGREIKNIIDLA